MQICKWIKPGTDETRYYVSTRFGGAPFLSYSDNAAIDGMWIGCDQESKARVMHKTMHGVGTATERSWHMDSAFGLSTWEAWEVAFNACLTKSGKFSIAKFMKYEA